MKEKYCLKIDTTKTNKTCISLETGNVRKQKSITSGIHTSQHVLPLIEGLCKEARISLYDITSIRVHTGPGSFTGLRVGAIVGITLGWLLDIPVNGKMSMVPPHLDYE